MSNLEYRGAKSLTFRLVLLCFLTGTALLLNGNLTGSEYITGIIGLVSAYVVKEGVSTAAEAYRDRGKPPGGWGGGP